MAVVCQATREGPTGGSARRVIDIVARTVPRGREPVRTLPDVIVDGNDHGLLAVPHDLVLRDVAGRPRVVIARGLWIAIGTSSLRNESFAHPPSRHSVLRIHGRIDHGALVRLLPLVRRVTAGNDGAPLVHIAAPPGSEPDGRVVSALRLAGFEVDPRFHDRTGALVRLLDAAASVPDPRGALVVVSEWSTAVLPPGLAGDVARSLRRHGFPVLRAGSAGMIGPVAATLTSCGGTIPDPGACEPDPLRRYRDRLRAALIEAIGRADDPARCGPARWLHDGRLWVECFDTSGPWHYRVVVGVDVPGGVGVPGNVARGGPPDLPGEESVGRMVSPCGTVDVRWLESPRFGGRMLGVPPFTVRTRVDSAFVGRVVHAVLRPLVPGRPLFGGTYLSPSVVTGIAALLVARWERRGRAWNVDVPSYFESTANRFDRRAFLFERGDPVCVLPRGEGEWA